MGVVPEPATLAPYSVLGPADRPAILRHLLALGADDRHRRFDLALSDAGMATWVAHLRFDRDLVAARRDDHEDILGLAYLGLCEPWAEFGISVLPTHRQQGVASGLLTGCLHQVAERGLRGLSCQTGNLVILRAAGRLGYPVILRAGCPRAHIEARSVRS